MDLNQRKLNKSEWDSIEVPVSKCELDVLKLIVVGYHDVNIKMNLNSSIFSFLKIEYNEKMEDYIYNKYLSERIQKIEQILKVVDDSYKPIKVASDAKLNSADRVRLERFDESIIKKYDIYEFVLLSHIEQLLFHRKEKNIKEIHFHYYTLYKLSKNNIFRLNRHIVSLVKKILDKFADEISNSIIIDNGVEFIERNDNLLKYNDMVLYEHQKEIFVKCKSTRPKLILYMAPTGTGKTMTPIGLSEQKRIIFVCAARHVGLALARSAISIGKKIAFAFGCSSADDIRLHNFAAKEYKKNKRTGGIGKIDNSAGDYVQIMICDIKSYLPAMYYMLAFFKAEDIILYWDEPTITMDYDEHDFHKTIRANWKKNLIPNVVLSSATLPKENELSETIPDFRNKFANGEVYNIVSHDCKKSIPMINKDGEVVLPHYLCKEYSKLRDVAEHCNNYLTLLRYFDLKEVIEFIGYVTKNNYVGQKMTIDRNFHDLDDINMQNIKKYYVKLLANIKEENWDTIYNYFMENRMPRILENNSIDAKGNRIKRVASLDPGSRHQDMQSKLLAGKTLTRIASEQIIFNKVPKNVVQKPEGTSGAYITTKDSYTLTDGPTIFISNDVEKVAKFCVQQANIPAIIMDDIMAKIGYNNVINEKLAGLEAEVDNIKEEADKRIKNSGSSSKSKGSSKDLRKFSRESAPENENRGQLNRLTNEINTLRSMIKNATLNDAFIPNRKLHLEKWAHGLDVKNAFSSSVDEQFVADIMALNGVDNLWKVLLMMGIGVFINHDNITYTEIMKRLAGEQKLYMIIATSDYIYGTNYQFCHGYLSKDLDLTQEKIIQAMGRIGRNNIQQTYTIRFRDDAQILKLFTSDTAKPEIINMNKLFNSHKVVFADGIYSEVEDDLDDRLDEDLDRGIESDDSDAEEEEEE